MPELQRNGDFIVALHQLKQSTRKDLHSDGDATALAEQLDRLLAIAGIRADRLGDECISGAAANPVPAMRAATVAARLAVVLSGSEPRDSQQEYGLNLLRLDLLLGVAGIQPTLEEGDLTRCMRDCRDLVYCLVGALSDVAATASPGQKREAMERYSRTCGIVFR